MNELKNNLKIYFFEIFLDIDFVYLSNVWFIIVINIIFNFVNLLFIMVKLGNSFKGVIMDVLRI